MNSLIITECIVFTFSFHSKKRQIIIMWLYCSRFVKLHLSLKMCIQDELNESIYK